ncbi:MAG: hypothetical protein HGA29_01390 [Syntrophaceae bacterium]|nr:hypothetical protein [Syntrophaceae bacterium]
MERLHARQEEHRDKIMSHGRKEVIIIVGLNRPEGIKSLIVEKLINKKEAGLSSNSLADSKPATGLLTTNLWLLTIK